MENNAKLALAQRIVEHTGASLFLTGKAGTGKTTFLRHLRDYSHKRIVVTAPTGIAAINAGGVTLHSFFQLDFGIFMPGHERRSKYKFGKDKLKIIRGMDLLVIDEVSMVRADLLDAVDDTLRRLRDRNRPFGGVQLLLIGDLQQLPPVANEEEEKILRQIYPSDYFFESKALQQLPYETVELDRVFRQNDDEYLGILNAIRDNRLTAAQLDRLNSCVRTQFSPSPEQGYIRLTTHNRMAAEINDSQLERLPGAEHTFECNIDGKFPEKSYPADKTLRLKEGAQVMFIKNDTGSPREYYNGMIGTVVAIDNEEGVAVRPADGGEIIHVHDVEWENVSYSVDEETKEIKEICEGKFRQLPLKTAWAVTIHKSQGLTFDRAIIDVSNSFAHGQAYVALSRCRGMQGLVLSNPVTPRAIICDNTVSSYLRQNDGSRLTEDYIARLEREYSVRLLDELFDFRRLFDAMEGVVRIYSENLSRRNPGLVHSWSEVYGRLRDSVVGVADRFRNQYIALSAQPDGDKRIADRVKSAASYFLGQMKPLRNLAVNAVTQTTNKKVTAKIELRVELFNDLLTAKMLLLDSFRTHDFSVTNYLDLKANAMLRDVKPKGRRHAAGRRPSYSVSDDSVPDLACEPDEAYGSPHDFMDE